MIFCQPGLHEFDLLHAFLCPRITQIKQIITIQPQAVKILCKLT